MKEETANYLSWLIPALATIIAALIVAFFAKPIKEKVKSFRVGDLNLRKSNNNNIKIVNNDIKQTSHDNYVQNQTFKEYQKLFELTDNLIKLASEAFRPVKFNSTKSFHEYLDETINVINEHIRYFDSKETFFNTQTCNIINDIHRIIRKCISHQQTIESYKAMNMPWKHITPEIEALTKLFKNEITNDLPTLRENLKEVVKKINLP